MPFYDADDFHPDANLKKMASGRALDDSDRIDWLLALNALTKRVSNAVVACSALKESYRKLLTDNLDRDFHFVYLKGTYDQNVTGNATMDAATINLNSGTKGAARLDDQVEFIYAVKANAMCGKENVLVGIFWNILTISCVQKVWTCYHF